MKTQILLHLFTGFCGILLAGYGILAAMEKTPVLSVVPLKSHKERQKEYRFQAIGYGGMGMIALLKCVCFFTGWPWAQRLLSASTTVITVYLLYALTFRIYRRGYMPGDMDENNDGNR